MPVLDTKGGSHEEEEAEDAEALKHVVMFSGGIGSWAAAKRVAGRYGTDGLTLLFADTLMEDEDLYRFIDEASANVGGQFVRIAEGRNPWQVFTDKRYLGNSRVDPCSRILKRELMRSWLESHCDPNSTVVHLGIDWTEEHRFKKAARHWEPWMTRAPLCEPPYVFTSDLFEQLQATGIAAPRLYAMGFAHNNCGGFCIKAGQAHFVNLLEKMPERFRYHEEQEARLQETLGKPVTIMRRQRAGVLERLSLTQLREEHEQDARAHDADDWGGCGCLEGEE